MDQWNHQNHQNHQLHQNQSSSLGPSDHSLMSHPHPPKEEEEVQYILRHVGDNVRLALCQAVEQRNLLWDAPRDKCSSVTRKRLFGEVVDDINAQFVLSPPISIEEVEKHWKNLKDTYVKTRRKLTFDQDGQPIRPKWKFFGSLMFLDSVGYDFVSRKRQASFPRPFGNYPVPAIKKDKLEEIPSDEYMEFCRSLYLPLKEIGYKDRVLWLKIQKSMRDLVFDAQIETATKAPPDIQ